MFTESRKIRANVDEKGERENRWLVSKEKESELLGSQSILISNSMTEKVPAELIAFIVSERAPLVPTEFARIKSASQGPRAEAKAGRHGAGRGNRAG